MNVAPFGCRVLLGEHALRLGDGAPCVAADPVLDVGATTRYGRDHCRDRR